MIKVSKGDTMYLVKISDELVDSMVNHDEESSPLDSVEEIDIEEVDLNEDD